AMKLAIGISVCMLAWVSAGLAQDISGSISGTVTDPSGAAVANAKVTVTNTDRNLVMRTLTTGQDGTYSATILPVGTYSLRIAATGFVTQQRRGIQLNANDKLTINVSLAIGS